MAECGTISPDGPTPISHAISLRRLRICVCSTRATRYRPDDAFNGLVGRLSDQRRIEPGGPMKVATPAQPMMFDDTAGPVFGHERR